MISGGVNPDIDGESEVLDKVPLSLAERRRKTCSKQQSSAELCGNIEDGFALDYVDDNVSVKVVKIIQLRQNH